jgi:hypothetical protein
LKPGGLTIRCAALSKALQHLLPELVDLTTN